MSADRASSWWSTIWYYTLVFAGFAALVAGAFVVPQRPIWLLVFGPVVGVWSVWLLNEYWRWVRNLGK